MLVLWLFELLFGAAALFHAILTYVSWPNQTRKDATTADRADVAILWFVTLVLHFLRTQ
jgi:hypothetical protein